MKLIPTTLLCACSSILAFGAYTENGKPVTTRNPVILSDQNNSLSESKDPEIQQVNNDLPVDTPLKDDAVEETTETEKTSPAKNDKSESDEISSEEPKEAPLLENSNQNEVEETLPEVNPVDSDENAAPPPEGSLVFVDSQVVDCIAEQPSAESTPVFVTSPQLPSPGKASVTTNTDKKERNRHAFLLHGFAGAGQVADDIDLEVSGVNLEYRYTLSDNRCNSCEFGNRWLFSLRFGYGLGESDDTTWTGYWGDRYKYNEVIRYFLTAGLSCQHQFSQSISLMLGAFIGTEYVSAEYSNDPYYYYYDYKKSESVSDFSLCAGASAALCFEFGKHHSIEVGAEVYYSSSDFKDDAPAWKTNQLYGLIKIGYGYHF